MSYHKILFDATPKADEWLGKWIKMDWGYFYHPQQTKDFENVPKTVFRKLNGDGFYVAEKLIPKEHRGSSLCIGTDAFCDLPAEKITRENVGGYTTYEKKAFSTYGIYCHWKTYHVIAKEDFVCYDIAHKKTRKFVKGEKIGEYTILSSKN